MAERIASVKEAHNIGARAPEKKRGISPMERTILTDFYLSFYFSQGNPDFQRYILKSLCPYYNLDALRQDFGSSDTLGQRLTPRFARLRIPSPHPDPGYDEKDNTKEIKKEFKRFGKKQIKYLKKLLDDPDSRYHQKPTEGEVINLVRNMTERDLNYLSNGGRKTLMKSNNDPFASHVKDYIIDQKPTGSVEYDALFADLFEITEKALNRNEAGIAEENIEAFQNLSIKLKKLHAKWSDKHPQDPFTEEVPEPTEKALLEIQLKPVKETIQYPVADAPVTEILVFRENVFTVSPEVPIGDRVELYNDAFAESPNPLAVQLLQQKDPRIHYFRSSSDRLAQFVEYTDEFRMDITADLGKQIRRDFPEDDIYLYPTDVSLADPFLYMSAQYDDKIEEMSSIMEVLQRGSDQQSDLVDIGQLSPSGKIPFEIISTLINNNQNVNRQVPSQDQDYVFPIVIAYKKDALTNPKYYGSSYLQGEPHSRIAAVYILDKIREPILAGN